jgi:hypothetical protein
LIELNDNDHNLTFTKDLNKQNIQLSK